MFIEKETKMCPTADVEKKDFNLKEKIDEVEKTILQNKENPSPEPHNPKIQRVPKHLRERDLELHPYSVATASTTHHSGGAIFPHDLHDLPKHQNRVATRYYTPKMISIGPIHHNLKLGEKHKLRWTAKYVEETALNTQQLYEKIKNSIHELKELFEEEVIDDYKDDDCLSWMLFVDGCSLLYFMEHYNEKDPEANLGIKYDQLIYMSRDLILLENQLPYPVLVLLSKWEIELLRIMKDYANAFIYKRKHFITTTTKEEGGETQSTPGAHTTLNVDTSKPPTHLLDFVRSTILGFIHAEKEIEKPKPKPQLQLQLQRKQEKEPEGGLLRFVRKYILCQQTEAEPTYKNIRDLKAANIGVKKAKEGHGISYEYRFWILGNLRIPKFRVDDTSAVLIVNVIAFEMCPDFRNDYEVSSFVAFLESIIDDAEDVKVLRKAGIIINVLGSDEEVAQLFNSFSSDLVVEDRKYFYVKRQIEYHYSHRVRTWIAEFLYNHFRSPWTLAAFSAAVIALALSGIQTYVTVFPKDNN